MRAAGYARLIAAAASPHLSGLVRAAVRAALLSALGLTVYCAVCAGLAQLRYVTLVAAAP